MAAPSSPTALAPSDHSSDNSRSASHHDDSTAADSIPVETLVQHLLDAKRSLSTMELVLRANDLVTTARQAYQESVVLGAQSDFIRRGIDEEQQLLLRARKSMNRTYETGNREFKQIIKNLDAAHGRLEDTMSVLRGRAVETAFRPKGEEKKNLLDFVDVMQVDTMQNSLKDNIAALQATQESFAGDLRRFDADMRRLRQALAPTAAQPSPSASNIEQPVELILASMVDNSHHMAELLASLTKHFDLCVTAVRTTEGAAALARRKAAEVTQASQSGEDVSISGVIAEQESHMADLEPITTKDRVEMLQIVVTDAAEVGEVVQEITESLQTIQEEFARLDEQTGRVKAAYDGALAAFRALEDIGSRLQGYIAAESEFRDRWSGEHESIGDKMSEMEALRTFYETYASAYDSLLLEVDRRRGHEDRVRQVWAKARDAVERIVEADRRHRESFRNEMAEYIPTDLWPGLDGKMRRWDVVPVRHDEGVGEEDGAAAGSTPALAKSVVQAAAMRLGQQQGAGGPASGAVAGDR